MHYFLRFRQYKGGATSYTVSNRGYHLPSDLESRSQGSYSVADRSGAEITEYHHYSSEAKFDWKED